MRDCLLRLSAIGSLAILALPSIASATHAVGSTPWKEGISVEAGLSYSSIYSEELVFDDAIAPGYKLSELDWDADLVLAGVSGSFRHQRWVASAGIWTSLDTMDGSMVDYDWLYPEIPDWSDRSMGEATLDLTSFDVNAGYSVLKSDSMALDLVVGYRQDELAWADFGGTYIYSTDGFRDDVGQFPDEIGITYDQTFEVPYVGIHAHLKMQQALTLTGYALYSPIAEISAEDHHIAREIHFIDEFSDAEYIGAGAHATWQINTKLHAGLAFDYQSVPEVIGDDTVIEEGITYTDGAGISLEMITVSVTLGYAF